MLTINYPERKPAVRIENGHEQIFCLVRKKWVRITPEEWVRQNFLLYLIDVERFPQSLIAVEKKVLVGSLSQRFDLVLYDRKAKPICLVECKEQNVSLSTQTLLQVLRYNSSLQVKFLIITNGNLMKIFSLANSRLLELEAFPELLSETNAQ